MSPKCQRCGKPYLGGSVIDNGVEKFLCERCRPGSHYQKEATPA